MGTRPRSWRMHDLAPVLVAALLSMAAGCHAGTGGTAPMQQIEGGEMAKQTTSRGRNTDAGTQWSASNKLARLEGGFSLDADGRTLRIEYTVTNIGQYPLVVFDRGDAYGSEALGKRLAMVDHMVGS